MSVELYSNGASTTIAEDLDNSETGVDVTSATGFPITGNFRVLVDSELMIVTGVSGTTFTVIRGAEGTTAASHTNGATITHVVTRDSQRAIFSQLYGCGFRQAVTTADFTWVNQGTATATDTAYGISLVGVKTSSGGMRLLKKAAPSTPYTITAVIRSPQFTGNYSGVGLSFRQSSDGKCHNFLRLQTGAFSSEKWTSPTVWSAAYTSLTVLGGYDPMILRIADDGTYRKCSLSPDGVSFIEVHSVSRTDFLTADEVGFVVYIGQNTWDVPAHLLAWEQA